jgi:hypothetical protein
MSFASARVAIGNIPLRGLTFGDAFPVVQATNETIITSPGTLTITKPSGTIDGDLLLAHFSRRWDSSTDPPFVQTSGGTFTVVYQNTYGSGFQAGAEATMYRIVQAGDTTWDFDVQSSGRSSVFVSRIDGHDPVNPIGAFAFAVLGGTDLITFDGIFCDRTNGLLMHHPTCSHSLSGVGFTSGDPDTTEIHDASHGSGTNGHQHAVATEEFAEGGGTGPRTWTCAANGTDRRGGGWSWVRPILGTPDHLEFEGSGDDLLLEGGDFLILE